MNTDFACGKMGLATDGTDYTEEYKTAEIKSVEFV
jgi:hypothetical protein